MKLFLSALCASFMIAPLSFAASVEELKDDTIAADCGKCKKDGEKEEAKEEGTLVDCGKCKKDGDKEEAKEEGTLAGGCGKCKKDGEKEEAEEGALA